MKRFSFRIVLFAAALCCGAMPANAQTLTFSGLANSCGGAGYTAFGGIYVESGYQLVGLAKQDADLESLFLEVIEP